jgi:hypothetical protein
MGPVRDPIKSLVECGIGDDIDTVIVDGIDGSKAAVSWGLISRH